MTLTQAARSYLGTRFRHRGRSRVGMDCAGLIWCAYRDCGVTLPDNRLYGREPFNDGLVDHLTAALGEPVGQVVLQPEDVIVVRFDTQPHHVAMLVDAVYGDVHALNMIHADGHTGRVIEQRLTRQQSLRITHVFRRGL